MSFCVETVFFAETLETGKRKNHIEKERVVKFGIMRAKAVNWFLTESGRTFSLYGVAALGMGLTSATYVPNTFLLYKYREFVQFYQNGKEVPLNKEVQDRYNKCLEILNCSSLHKKLLQPFSVFGFDLFHAGSCSTRYGALIGIPANFAYKSKEDINKEQLLVNLKKVDWESEAGKKLANAIILPEKVQLFAICREILSTQNKKIFLDSVYPMACVSLVYAIGSLTNRKIDLYSRPTLIRGVMYTILAVYAIGLYFFFKDFTEVSYEADVDEQLCELGQDFIESGIIFYDKLLQRNQALRELMGDEGKKKYSKLGNENFIIRQPRIPLVHRKMYFEAILKEKMEGETKEEEKQ